MSAAQRLPEQLEERCPACGAAFAPSLGARRKKVQCPKCREIVVLAAAPTPVVLVESKAEPPAAALSALAARVELLEKQLEWLMDHRPAAEAALLRPGQKLRWLRGARAVWNGEGEQGEILLHNLRALRSAGIKIVVAEGDARARKLSECLAEIFRQAAWRVDGPHEKLLPPGQQGLALLAAACPVSEAVTSASM